MKKISHILFVCLIVFFVLNACQGKKEKVTPHVLLITGGHGYDEAAFNEMLEKLPVTYDHVKHPDAHVMLKKENIARYDAVLLYDMPKEISEEAQKDFIAMLEEGKGLVVLHHAFCSYDFWPEYLTIIGGRYQHYPWEKDGVEQPVSTSEHDVPFDVKLVDKTHPVTKGVEDFRITVETYVGTRILLTLRPLLSTDEPTRGPLFCWTNPYKNSRVVTFTLGHDHLAWEHPAFLKILSQSLLWVSQP